MRVYLTSKGDFNKTEGWLDRLLKKDYTSILHEYGKRGVDALSTATPKDSGKTAESWGYEIHHSANETYIEWTNTNINKGVSIAIILQYGHGTGTGGYVQGRDYINPALRPIFDKMADEVWKEVTMV